ncbi:hypothetical protein AB5I41_21540 [Sphingomonas sp. MMS24-JH45]
MNWVRTIVFRTIFYILSVPIVATVPISALFGQRAVIRHSDTWSRVHRWLMRGILGIRPRVEGTIPVASFSTSRSTRRCTRRWSCSCCSAPPRWC